MAKFNIVFPVEVGANKALVTSTRNNKSRINFLLKFLPGQRPYYRKYGSILSRIEQSVLPMSAIAVTTFDELKTTMQKYAAEYYIVDSILIEQDKVNPTHRMNLQINYSDVKY